MKAAAIGLGTVRLGGLSARLRRALLGLVLAVTVTMPAAARASATDSLAGPVYDYLATRQGTTTVAVHDLVSGQQWWWHVSVRGYTASIVKADILAALMYHNATLSPRQRSLAAAMIERSDNAAATTLGRRNRHLVPR